jgi:spermidine synthase
MIPWELVDRGPIPGKRGELRLYRRGDEFSIRVDRYELMNSRVHASEDALAELACERMTYGSCRRLLIGGLGMGYTAAAALQRLGPDDRLVVAELVPAVVTWNRGPLADLTGRPLEDARVTVREGDVAEIIKAEQQAYDAILLDVDNGPDGITKEENDWLYSQGGLNAAYKSLRPAGVLAVWSARSNLAFGERLRRAGFEVEEVRAHAHVGRKGTRHTIWLAKK